MNRYENTPIWTLNRNNHISTCDYWLVFLFLWKTIFSNFAKTYISRLLLSLNLLLAELFLYRISPHPVVISATPPHPWENGCCWCSYFLGGERRRTYVIPRLLIHYSVNMPVTFVGQNWEYKIIITFSGIACTGENSDFESWQRSWSLDWNNISKAILEKAFPLFLSFFAKISFCKKIEKWPFWEVKFFINRSYWAQKNRELYTVAKMWIYTLVTNCTQRS
jgi:hypothetical protein